MVSVGEFIGDSSNALLAMFRDELQPPEKWVIQFASSVEKSGHRPAVQAQNSYLSLCAHDVGTLVCSTRAVLMTASAPSSLVPQSPMASTTPVTSILTREE